MEQQTVSITKAGIIATLNARTSILASANPVESRYNARLSVVENIKLPPTLLSRFDLIYLILDKPHAENDRRLARHLVSMYFDEADRVAMNPGGISQEFLRDYIIYARSNITPELSDEAAEDLVKYYLEMRSLGNRGTKTITATPRQLESLIRISQALAKMKLSSKVGVEEVREAARLMKVATQAAATDPRTGTIDMDLINTGRSAIDKDLVMMLAEQIRIVLSSRKGQRFTLTQIRSLITENTDAPVTLSAVEEATRELEGEGILQFNDRTMTVVVRGSI
jgi:DNA replication licensing factor MCM4